MTNTKWSAISDMVDFLKDYEVNPPSHSACLEKAHELLEQEKKQREIEKAELEEMIRKLEGAK